MGIIQFIQVVFYGIVEGITEWLPISSTGHLIIFESIWPMAVREEFLSVFRVVIQLGAMLAVVILYWERLYPFNKHLSPKRRSKIWQMWFKVAAACIPAVIAGYFLDDWMDAHLYIWQVVAVTLILFGVAFVLVERYRNQQPAIRSLDQLSYRGAFVIGMFQMLALVPGVSRSGATMIGALLIGCSRTVAAEFSFFLAIPIMFGASLLKTVKFVKVGLSFTGVEAMYLVIGMIAAFAVSMLVIRMLTDYIKKRSFTAFGIYRIGLGLIVLTCGMLIPGLLK